MKSFWDGLWLWLGGLLAIIISAFSTAASGFLMLPQDFNFSHQGLINMLRVSGLPALVAGLAYLKQHPLPGINIPTPGAGATQDVLVHTETPPTPKT